MLNYPANGKQGPVQQKCPKSFRPLKGQCHEIFASGFFHESSSPKSLKKALRSFQFFQKFVEIFTSQCAPPVSTTPVANLPPVSTTNLTTCSAQTRSGIGLFVPSSEPIPCRQKLLRRTRLLRDPAQTQV
jgi:hypothetical protein